MKNFISQGSTLTITAAAITASGAGVLAGTIFGVAANDAAIGDGLVLNLTGVFELPKTESQAWTVGAAIYWDAAESKCTTVAEDNILIGAAMAAVGSGATETLGVVRLNGSFGHPVVNEVP